MGVCDIYFLLTFFHIYFPNALLIRTVARAEVSSPSSLDGFVG